MNRLHGGEKAWIIIVASGASRILFALFPHRGAYSQARPGRRIPFVVPGWDYIGIPLYPDCVPQFAYGIDPWFRHLWFLVRYKFSLEIGKALPFPQKGDRFQGSVLNRNGLK